jgi:hypothetical protein
MALLGTPELGIRSEGTLGTPEPTIGVRSEHGPGDPAFTAPTTHSEIGHVHHEPQILAAFPPSSPAQPVHLPMCVAPTQELLSSPPLSPHLLMAASLFLWSSSDLPLQRPILTLSLSAPGPVYSLG